jgi:tRNA threonylcarbamoyladenosine biosynthesis protein TsaE
MRSENLFIDLPDEAATATLGGRIAALVAPGLIIYLQGELGAGKTSLARALIQTLGHDGKVKSPTYGLVEPYVVSKLDLYHFDFYRFTDPEEWNTAGCRDLFNDHSVCLVEWPEKAFPLVPTADLTIRLEHAPSGRRAHLNATSPRGQTILASLIS